MARPREHDGMVSRRSDSNVLVDALSGQRRYTPPTKMRLNANYERVSA